MSRKGLSRASLRIAVIGALFTLCLGSGPTAIANDEQQSEDQSAVIAANLADEYARYAEDYGVSVEEAQARSEDRLLLDDYILPIRGSRADKFTGFYSTHTADAFTFHIVRKEGTDATIDLPRLQTARVVYESAPRSWAELKEIQNALDDIQGIESTAPNIHDGVVEVQAGDVAAAEAISRFGSAVHLSEVSPDAHDISCSTRTDCDQPRGGVEIINFDYYPSPKLVLQASWLVAMQLGTSNS